MRLVFSCLSNNRRNFFLFICVKYYSFFKLELLINVFGVKKKDKSINSDAMLMKLNKAEIAVHGRHTIHVHGDGYTKWLMFVLVLGVHSPAKRQTNKKKHAHPLNTISSPFFFRPNI